MMRKLFGVSAVTGVLWLIAWPAYTADQAPVQEKAQTKKQEQIYGS